MRKEVGGPHSDGDKKKDGGATEKKKRPRRPKRTILDSVNRHQILERGETCGHRLPKMVRKKRMIPKRVGRKRKLC